jgi:hypothetical protein
MRRNVTEAGVDDVELFFIGTKAEANGAIEIVSDDGEFTGVRIEAIDVVR